MLTGKATVTWFDEATDLALKDVNSVVVFNVSTI
jgi:hypothetical protein